MIPDPTLTLAWLVLAHFVADFVLQTDRMATDKGADGRQGLAGMVRHAAAVAVCLVPVVFAFGGPGVAFLLIVSVSHGLIDRAKILWTRRADAIAAEAAASAEVGASAIAASSAEAGAVAVPGAMPPTDGGSVGLGPAWTPVPGALFILDQFCHLAITVVFWAIFLDGVALTVPFADFIGRLFARWDPTTVHTVVLWAVVLASLLIVNIRAASFFVSTLVMPRPVLPSAAKPAPVSPAATTTTVRVGPFSATTETMTTPPIVIRETESGETPPPDRIGETIGVLERLLIVIFVLGGAAVAVGLVIAAKTIARFRQLDDRAFAEYYLLGTLASVTVAVVSALVAAAALGI